MTEMIDNLFNDFKGVTVSSQREAERLIPPLLTDYSKSYFVHVVGYVELGEIECSRDGRDYLLDAFTGFCFCAETGDGDTWTGGSSGIGLSFILADSGLDWYFLSQLKNSGIYYDIPVFEIVKDEDE